MDWSSALGELRDRLQGTLLTTFVGVVISLVVSPTIELFVTLCSSLSSKDVSFDDYQQCVNTTQYPLTSPLAPNALASSDVVLGNVSDLRAIMDVLTVIVFVVPLVDMYLHFRGTWNHVAAWVLCKQVYFCTHDCGLLCYRPKIVDEPVDASKVDKSRRVTWSPHRCLWLSWYLFAFVCNFSLVFLAVFVSVGVTYEDAIGGDHPLFDMYVSMFSGSLTTVFLIAGSLTASRFLLSMILVSHPWKDVDAKDSDDDPVIYSLAPSSIQKLTPYGVRAFCDVDFSLDGTGAYLAGFPRGFQGKSYFQEMYRKTSCFNCTSWYGCCSWTGKTWSEVMNGTIGTHYPDLHKLLFVAGSGGDRERVKTSLSLCPNCQDAFLNGIVKYQLEKGKPGAGSRDDEGTTSFISGEWMPVVVNKRVSKLSDTNFDLVIAYRNVEAHKIKTGFQGRLDSVKMDSGVIQGAILFKDAYPKSVLICANRNKMYGVLVKQEETESLTEGDVPSPSDAASSSKPSTKETIFRRETPFCFTTKPDRAARSETDASLTEALNFDLKEVTTNPGDYLFVKLEKDDGKDIVVYFVVSSISKSPTGISVSIWVGEAASSNTKDHFDCIANLEIPDWKASEVLDIGVTLSKFSEATSSSTSEKGTITVWNGKKASNHAF